MYRTYSHIFSKCGLQFRAVEADTGSIGGSFSHEFMVLAETGEDQIVNCRGCDYAANLEKAEIHMAENLQSIPSDALTPIEEVETPNIKTVEEVTDFLSISPDRLIKTLIFKTNDETLAVLVRGDHELNEAKLRSLLATDHVELADPASVAEVTGAPMGFAGPVGLKVRIVGDHAIRGMQDAVTGGNKKNFHIKNVNLKRDFQVNLFGDLRTITPEDVCPRCGGEIHFGRGIEVGHIFKLGTKYSESMGALFLDEQGTEKPIIMGCYGIGVGRTAAAAIEQNHDQNGIIFPISIAPFEVVILPLQMHEAAVIEAAEKIHEQLLDAGVDALLDDRDVRAGIKFNDADLLGTPLRIMLGTRNLKDGKAELRRRTESESTLIPVENAVTEVQQVVRALATNSGE